ncbi:type II and III secretion system protein family protein [Basilea psittacipulmonis]|uniref:type II and III secretion system protein family protein n=1 Tax=Basilea psittacipulmonis TaxID=1472345 RepID=UPI00068BD038|nr:pilus assembly protein N-terminal domain-containing protein [Basilea psittacipulmonis]
MRLFITVLFFIVQTCLLVVHASTVEKIDLMVGDIHLIKEKKIEKVAVGDGKIINVLSDNESEIVIFAKEVGSTTLQVWFDEEQTKHYQVQVSNPSNIKLKADLERLLSSVKGIKVSQLGEQMVVEGYFYSKSEQLRFQRLKEHYPNLIDMTQSGWEKMILLEVEMLELPKNYLRNLGVSWEHEITGNVFGDMLFNVLPSLQALRNEGGGVMLAQPKLMTRSGTAAEFLAGGEFPYQITDTQGRIHTQFKSYGVKLSITPEVLPDEAVSSQIALEISALDNSLTVNGGPALKTRRINTQFNVKSGQTAILAGFISKEQSQGLEGIPGISQVPILGDLFKSEKFQSNETELVILVTPRIITNDSPLQAAAQRSQMVKDASFGTSEGILPTQNKAKPKKRQHAPSSQWQKGEPPKWPTENVSDKGKTKKTDQKNKSSTTPNTKKVLGKEAQSK